MKQNLWKIQMKTKVRKHRLLKIRADGNNLVVIKAEKGT